MKLVLTCPTYDEKHLYRTMLSKKTTHETKTTHEIFSNHDDPTNAVHIASISVGLQRDLEY